MTTEIQTTNAHTTTIGIAEYDAHGATTSNAVSNARVTTTNTSESGAHGTTTICAAINTHAATNTITETGGEMGWRLHMGRPREREQNHPVRNAAADRYVG